MSWGDRLFPSTLVDRGYTHVLVEPDVSLRGGNTQPDLVVASSSEKHVILWEAKESNNISVSQARVLNEIDGAACEDQLQIPASNAEDLTLSVSYLTAEPHGEPIVIDLEDHHLDHAVVCEFREDQETPVLKTLRGDLGPLTEFFEELRIDADEADPQIYPFDRSSELHEIAPHLGNPLVEFAISERFEFTAAELAESAMGPLWTNLGLAEAARGQIGARVDQVLVDATKSGSESRPLAGFLERTVRRTRGRSSWRFVDSGLNARSSHGALRNAISQLIELYRVEHGLFQEVAKQAD